MIDEDINRAALAVALATLERDPDYTHKIGLLAKHLDGADIKAIKDRRRELSRANKDMKALGVGLLSADAAAWWAQTKLVLAQGRRAQARGDRRAERRASLLSERQEETFADSVPDADKPKFLQATTDQDESAWDERWDYVEFRPPLLRPEFEGGKSLGNAMNIAQQEVIGSLLEPPTVSSPEEVQRFTVRMNRLRELAQDERAGQAAKTAKAEKKAKSAEVKTRREELVSRGDQKATRKQRAATYKLVKGALE